MSNSFLKFKRRARAHSIASAILIGIGSGLIGLAAVIAGFKLFGREADWFYYLICLGLGAVASAILYFVFMPSDRRLAKKLDSLYSLDERVSTMIELKNETGGLSELQRQDAESALSQSPIREFKSKRFVAGLIVFCLSVSLTVGAFILPTKADDGEIPIDEFNRQWLLTAIDELVSTVEIAYIDEGLKTASLCELRDLRAFIEGAELLSEMKSEAIDAVIGINAALKSVNSAEEIGKALSESSNEKIKQLGKEMSDLSGSGTRKALESLGKEISKSTADEAGFIADELNARLTSSGVRTDDAVYIQFRALIACAKSDHSDADDEFEEAGKTLSTSVLMQSVNRATMDVVVARLCNLFGITEDDVKTVDPETEIEIRDPSHKEETPEDTEGKEPDVDIGTGGLGTGETVYGSDDLIFDPDTGTYRPYGDVINEYFAKVNEYITDGKVSEEMASALEEYFAILFGGAKNDENDK